MRTDAWLTPVRTYLNVYDIPITNYSLEQPKLEREDELRSRVYPQALLNISGVLRDKIQFFTSAYYPNDPTSISSYISHPSYTGDTIIISHPKNILPADASLYSTSDNAVFKKTRLDIPYQVKRFNSNHIIIEATNPSVKPIWMHYADLWHPGWRATVNGEKTAVFQSNLAYKAVRIKPGENRVHFFFYNHWLALLQKIIGAMSLFWILYIGHLLIKIAFNRMPSASYSNE
jgi:uncharacterized membrane protein YfhO